jgi:polar amino acid transport system substrate-binding protein
MFSRRAFIALVLTLAAGPTWAGESAVSVAPEISRIRDRGRLIVAIAGFEVPPFVTISADGELAGRDVALAQGMASVLGVPVEFDRRAESFDAIIDILARHEADLAVSRLSATLPRALRVRFSHPYLVLHQALLLNRPRLAPLARERDPLEALNAPDVEIAVVEESGYADYAKQLLPKARLAAFSRWEPDIVEAVLRGEVLGALGDELAVDAALAARPAAALQLRSLVLADRSDLIAVALPWDSAQLAAWVDLYLESVAKPSVPPAAPALEGKRE